MRRLMFLLVSSLSLAAVSAGPALACGGLIGPNGAVNLLRTTTLAGYRNGVEHYVTAFSFAGGGGKFGSIVPLPGIPTKVERGGNWTLQRLVRETQPPVRAVAFAARELASAVRAAEVILETRVDALDLTVLRGGGSEVGIWAKQNGFTLPPDAPEVLDFYARRSPIFLAARFDAEAARARGQAVGDGTPIHLTIPTDDPWVPLRILALGKKDGEPVQANVYLLTDERPSILPVSKRGLSLERREPASPGLLDDLRADKGMGWVGASGMWFSHVVIDARAGDLRYDLAVDAEGGTPSRADAGLGPIEAVAAGPGRPSIPTALVLAMLMAMRWAAARRPASVPV